MPDISVIVPCYNEEELLADTVPRILEVLGGLSGDSEVLLVDDGSADGTANLIEELASKHPRVHGLRLPGHHGKGAALTRGFREARGKVAAFIDADLEIEPRFLIPLVREVRNGADAAIGSKPLGAAGSGQRTAMRRAGTAGYNGLVKLVLNSRLHDHQAGIKAFRGTVLKEILPEMVSEGWIWDTEVLLRLQKRECAIVELPVEIAHQRISRLNFFLDASRMLMGVLGLRRLGLRLGGETRKPAAESSVAADSARREPGSEALGPAGEVGTAEACRISSEENDAPGPSANPQNGAKEGRKRTGTG